jgi:6-pyruvoyltetrahydropterin/6-carboxytetrahydropterin synthase
MTSTPSSTTSLHIHKDRLKFAAAHMTVFVDGTKEKLHGHNYQLFLTLNLKTPALAQSLPQLVPFSLFKTSAQQICDEWDEHLLLAEVCPFLKITEKNQTSVDFQLCGVRYVIPSHEIIWIPTDNITTETLAQYFSQRFLELIKTQAKAHALDFQTIKSIEIRIEETPGQGSSHCVYF